MNIKELKKIIDNLPDDMEVILQKDSEGNGYSPLSGGDTEAVYIPEEGWYGEVYSTKWTAEDADMEDEDWDGILAQPRVLVLYPMN